MIHSICLDEITDRSACGSFKIEKKNYGFYVDIVAGKWNFSPTRLPKGNTSIVKEEIAKRILRDATTED